MKNFFENYRRFAIIGLSRDPKSFSRRAAKLLVDEGCSLVAVNPQADNIDGITSVPSISQLPEVDGVIFFTNPQVTITLLQQCLDQGIKRVWFQQGSADDAVLEQARKLGLNYVDSCVFLHHPRAGFPHNVHRALSRIFKI
ncbi:MAG: CoA-binding protein [Syntrophomonadaceae bacterium]|jgi:predicted CoA-binding protein|nr:CoA-binding protein [Syntrophomonadaceae bacterium]